MDAIIRAIARTNPDKAEKLRIVFTPDEWAASDSRKYNALSLEQKVAAARKLDEAIIAFLKVLTE
ncbi:MAG: hypothetical protein PHZ00_06370 [Candidatus Peribacteraceae bacterium]|nr:hypothetical protein [Candidatus Peribacteraceae bacterium]